MFLLLARQVAAAWARDRRDGEEEAEEREDFWRNIGAVEEGQRAGSPVAAWPEARSRK